ncbi:MAG: S1C family serine protease [Solirubrobacteraceae bacterium]
MAGALAGGLIALAVAGGSTTTHSSTTTVVQPAGSSSIPTSVTANRGLSVNQIYRQASPGVVDIIVTSQSSGGGFNPFGNGGGQQQTQGEGAGAVYDRKGDILTDEHVVAGATSVKVKFQDGYTTTAKVLGTDPSTDVGVIHVEAPTSELHPIPFADSSAAQVGDPVVAIGSPFSLPETTTTGIVSAVGRSITAPNNYTITAAIQTDAAINPGNSGGPLLDASGHVLGLNDQIQTSSGSSAGVGFAVPSNTVARIANLIIAGRSVKHSYVGVSLDASSTGGAKISTQPDQQGRPPVLPGSPAAGAGLRPGDVITAINGKAVSSTSQFIQSVDRYPPGTKLTLTIKRGGGTQQIPITLGTRPNRANSG